MRAADLIMPAPGARSPAVTDEMRYLFDLQGFLVVPRAGANSQDPFAPAVEGPLDAWILSRQGRGNVA